MSVTSDITPDRNGMTRGMRVNAKHSAPLLQDLGAGVLSLSTDQLDSLKGMIEFVLEGIEAELERRQYDASDPAANDYGIEGPWH